MVQDRHVVTTHRHRKYHMVYRFVPYPMTLNDPKRHSPVQGFLNAILWTLILTVSTNTARRAIPRRQLSFLYKETKKIKLLFLTRRYASAVYAMGLYQSSSMSVASECFPKRSYGLTSGTDRGFPRHIQRNSGTYNTNGTLLGNFVYK